MADSNNATNGNRIDTVAGNEKITVGGQQSLSVGSRRDLRIGSNENISVGGSRSTNIATNETLSVGASRNVTVQLNESSNVMGQKRVVVDKDLVITVGKKVVIDAWDSLELKVGAASLILKKDGTIHLVGKDISIKSSGKLEVKNAGNDVIKGTKIFQN